MSDDAQQPPPPQQGPTPFEVIGGDAVVRRLVDRFYDEMDEDPSVKTLRDMHPTNMKTSRDKLYMFLSGWLGGPQLYWEKYGHPRLRRRHFPFAVDTAAKDEWMRCMNVALDEVIDDEGIRQRLSAALDQLAAHMINR